uniref:DDE Tnp4 domain-containing protein n=1 Tax=Heligmosomoides polygyrus TaxID=6339 RepID=A0A183FNX1_HELPZ
MLIRAATPRHFRPRLSPLDVLDDHAFRQRFQISRRGFQFVLGLIEEDLSPETMRSHSLSFWERREEFVTWPTDEERVAMSRRLFALCGIPNIVGAIDGTHVKIIAPTEWENCYVNRKGFRSINVGTIADLDLKFIWLNVAFPGKTHDSRKLISCFNILAWKETWRFLGDSAYRLEQFLLKPYLGDGRTEAQLRFIEELQKGRVCVECAFGALKRQFLAPHGAAVSLGSNIDVRRQFLHISFRYNPTTAGKITNTAVCLRNLCILMNEAAFDSVEESASDYGDAGDKLAAEQNPRLGSHESSKDTGQPDERKGESAEKQTLQLRSDGCRPSELTQRAGESTLLSPASS